MTRTGVLEHFPIDPAVTMDPLANEAPTYHRVDDRFGHEQRTLEVTCDLVSQTSTSDYCAHDRQAAGAPQHNNQRREIDTFWIWVLAHLMLDRPPQR